MTIIEELREIAQRKCNCYEVARMLGFECGVYQCNECIARLIGSIADRIEAEQALPEGMEWPRFEDGELVRIGDEVEFEGETWKVRCAILRGECWALNVERGYDLVTGRGDYGERVKRPKLRVLGADGVPIEVGDTVWATYDGRKYVVKAVCSDGSLNPEMVTDDGCMVKYVEGGWDFAKKVTHERPDSWERLEEDATKPVCEYAGAQKSIVDADRYTCLNCPYDEPGPHTDAGCNERMRLDLMRRAKALAKAGE